MAFNSFNFVFLFLPLAVTGYWLLARSGRVAASVNWLLASSVLFYAVSSFRSLLILTPSIVTDYLIARSFFALDPSKHRARATLIAVGIVGNILLLSYFKYRNFFFESASALFSLHIGASHIALPLGISFLVFQKIAFLCDISSGKIAKVGLREFLLFALFFPRTIAGPIVQYDEIVPQFERPRSDAFSNIAVGFCLFAIGLFKKCVIADGISQFVPLAFEPYSLDTPVTLADAWSGALAYTFQLYFDFSGYSDMALGSARMLGIKLPMNFNSPLKASSMVEYWGRWHITLTRFLTWYVYVPLARRLTRFRAVRRKSLLRGADASVGAILYLIGLPTGVTMLVSGVWHGVGWPFVVWGLLHGLYLTVNQGWRLLRSRFWANPSSYVRVMKPVGRLLTFLCVVVALVVFRSQSVPDAIVILKGMVGLHGVTPHLVKLAQQAGFGYDWVQVGDPFVGLKCDMLLLCVVMILPNSLEILRRFRPALDFPDKDQGALGGLATDRPKIEEMPKAASLILGVTKVRVIWARLRDIWSNGVSLNLTTAIGIAVIFILGAMAIGRGGGFVYGGF